MNKKIVGGLLGILFVTSMVQTNAILKMQNIANSPKMQAVTIDASSQNQVAAVVSSQKTTSTVLEDYLKSKYPKDHLVRIQRINSKIEALLVANGLDEGNTAIQKNIFHRIWCGLMGMNYYQEFMGGGVYCARIAVGTPYALPDGGSGSITDRIIASQKISEDGSTNPYYLDHIDSGFDIAKVSLIQEGVEKILRDEGVDTKALGGPGWRRFWCRFFGGTWSDGVADFNVGGDASDDVTVWSQSCAW